MTKRSNKEHTHSHPPKDADEARQTDAPVAQEGQLSRRAFLASSAGVALTASMGSMGWMACDGATPGEGAPDGDGGASELTAEQRAQQQREANCRPLLDQDKGKAVTLSPESIAHDDALFALGVQAGVIESSSALLWTLTTDKAKKHLKVWRESETKGEIIQVAALEASPDEDGFCHIPVEGLAAGARYHYAFFDAEEPTKRSPIGTFRTAFRDDCLQPLTVAGTACTHIKRYPEFKSLQYMAKQSPDIFCHMGDMSYNDGASTKEEYAQKWKKTLSSPGYQAIFASTGIYATWDDHETTDNSKLYDLPPEHRQLARDSYRAHVALPRHKDGRLWTSYRWGLTAEFFVLDCRSEREDGNYISPTQMDWLKKGLKESPCHFKIILNSVPIIAMPPIWTLVKDDRWEGYPKQRDELLDHITEQAIGNVWFLGGDYHVGVVAKIEKEGPRSHMYEILVGPGGNHLPTAFFKLLGENEENKDQFAPSDQFDYFKSKSAATLLTFDPIEDHVHVRFVDPETDETLYDQKISQTKA